MKKNKPSYFISLKNDETLLTVRGNNDVPAYCREDSMTVDIKRNKDGVLYAFFDRRNNQTGSSYLQVWILDSVERMIKATDKALAPKRYYPDIAWNIPIEKDFCYFDDRVRKAFKDATFAPKYVSKKWNWQSNYLFTLHDGVTVS